MHKNNSAKNSWWNQKWCHLTIWPVRFSRNAPEVGMLKSHVCIFVSCHLVKPVYFFIYNRNICVYVLLYWLHANSTLYFAYVHFILVCLFVISIRKNVFENKPQWKTQLEFIFFLETLETLRLGSEPEWIKTGSQENIL